MYQLYTKNTWDTAETLQGKLKWIQNSLLLISNAECIPQRLHPQDQCSFYSKPKRYSPKTLTLWVANLHVNAKKEHLKAILRRTNMEGISTDFKFAVTAEMETVASPKEENLESKLR